MALRLRHGIRAIVALGAIGVSTALVACGGSDGSSGEAQANAEDAGLEFARCMRERGVDIPDPKPGSGGGFSFEFRGDPRQNENFEEAREACGGILENAIPEGERPDPAEIRDKLHQMTECLRDQGYDVPEPQVFGPGEDPPDEPAEPPSEEMQDLMDDPEFEQAQEDCSKEAGLPEGGPSIEVGPAGGGQGGPNSNSGSGN
jgi:hypothetical protein